jgi:hypothetical protein
VYKSWRLEPLAGPMERETNTHERGPFIRLAILCGPYTMNFMKAAATCKGKEILWLMPDGYIIAFCMSSLTCPPTRQFFLDQAFGSRAYGCVIWWWFLLLAYQFTLYMHSCLIASGLMLLGAKVRLTILWQLRLELAHTFMRIFWYIYVFLAI